MGYYGFIKKVEKDNYILTVEYGHISDSPYDSTSTVSKKIGLTKNEVNKIIARDTLGTIFFYEGMRIKKLY